MRVCLVTSTLPDDSCGIGDYTDRLARALVVAGLEVVVLASDLEQVRRAAPYRVLPVATRWRLGDARAIAHQLRIVQPDVVHLQFPGARYGRGFGLTSLPFVLRIQRRRPAILITIHEFQRLTPRVRARLAGAALASDAIVTPGEELVGAVKRATGGRLSPVRVVSIPLASNIQPPSEPGRPSVGFRRDADELVVGYWGYLRRDKGVLDLIAAFARVRTARRARLVIAGDPGPDAAYHRRVHEMVHAMGLEDDTVWTGPLSEAKMSETLLAFDVCVLPFTDGLTGNRGTYAAALAHAVPIITTRAPSGTTSAAAGTKLVAAGDVDSLASAIEAATQASDRPARVPAVTWDEIASRHVRLYKEIIA
jgi:polysaccharide biosynthesis protein PslF